MKFRKSSFSQGNGACVELASDGEHVYVRDSKDPGGVTVRLSTESWRSLLSDAKQGRLDALL